MKLCLLIPLFIISFASDCFEKLSYGQKHTIFSKTLNQKRDYYVHLPDSYNTSQRKYPILYLLHGQWDMLSAVASIELLSNEIPEIIIVGVQSQGQELHPIKGDVKQQTKLSQFLSNELIPHINFHYRVAQFKILSGHSNAGRFVMNEWIRDGLVFSHYYAFSPSLDDNQINIRLEKLTMEETKKKSYLTLTLANEGEHMLKPFKEIQTILKQYKSKTSLTTHFTDETHSSTRHKSLMHSLRNTFTGWQPSYETKIGNFENLKRHYDDFGTRFGFDAQIDLELLQRLSVYFAMSTKPEDALNINHVINYGLNLNRNNADAFWQMTHYLKEIDDLASAKKIEEKICTLQPDFNHCYTIKSDN
ncbi:hypothetical protein CJF42_05760 [Pseudoalteromonas sp. NBT06-2]|uniref:alpha/beta hydrolase n=1 Tax=Pseudoalteromonas sp. NBT06-2 TaxID=2025950 RepID=UPI000BA573A2|nr:alpha/beta hydrolase-fold protein [Pseudoalteromonas sp. NBT06-2]PAJ75347.1 hypothetical protein CJF42_05760 [Pseudoalteromonas sp. NBT06-2]